jgi:hypothetical protein
MISLEKLRKIDVKISDLTDDELEKIRQSFYDFGQLVFEDWHEQKFGSKYPTSSFPNKQIEDKI